MRIFSVSRLGARGSALGAWGSAPGARRSGLGVLRGARGLAGRLAGAAASSAGLLVARGVFAGDFVLDEGRFFSGDIVSMMVEAFSSTGTVQKTKSNKQTIARSIVE